MTIRRGGLRAVVVLAVAVGAAFLTTGPAAASTGQEKDPGVSLLTPGTGVSLLTPGTEVSLLGSPAVSLL